MIIVAKDNTKSHFMEYEINKINQSFKLSTIRHVYYHDYIMWRW
jgi:hypothetical protein